MSNKIIALGLLLFVGVAAYAQSGSVLVSEWTFSEGSGSVAVNSVTPYSTSTDGLLFGQANIVTVPLMRTAAYFYGPSEFEAGHSLALQPATGTIELWVKLAHSQDADIFSMNSDMLVLTGVPFGCPVYGMRVRETGAVAAFIADNGVDSPWRFVQTGGNLVHANNWHLLALSWDGSFVSIYVDGRLQASTAYSAIPDLGLSYSGDNPFMLAAGSMWNNVPASAHQFLGYMADVRIYNGARSAKDLKDDFAPKHQ